MTEKRWIDLWFPRCVQCGKRLGNHGVCDILRYMDLVAVNSRRVYGQWVIEHSSSGSQTLRQVTPPETP